MPQHTMVSRAIIPRIAELSAAQTGSLWMGSRRYPTGLDLGSVYASRLKESWGEAATFACQSSNFAFTVQIWEQNT